MKLTLDEQIVAYQRRVVFRGNDAYENAMNAAIFESLKRLQQYDHDVVIDRELLSKLTPLYKQSVTDSVTLTAQSVVKEIFENVGYVKLDVPAKGQVSDSALKHRWQVYRGEGRPSSTVGDYQLVQAQYNKDFETESYDEGLRRYETTLSPILGVRWHKAGALYNPQQVAKYRFVTLAQAQILLRDSSVFTTPDVRAAISDLSK